MSRSKNKYSKISSSFALSLYLFIILAGSFHPHHFNYSVTASITRIDKNASAYDEPFCLFSQINKPVYYYFHTSTVSVENHNNVIGCFPIVDYNQHFESYFYFVSLRAPPQFV